MGLGTVLSCRNRINGEVYTLSLGSHALDVHKIDHSISELETGQYTVLYSRELHSLIEGAHASHFGVHSLKKVYN